jgi:hypothetical protein
MPRVKTMKDRIAEAEAIYGDPGQHFMTPKQETEFYKQGEKIAEQVRRQTPQKKKEKQNTS